MDTATAFKEYNNLQVIAPVSIEQVEGSQPGTVKILIMGPTGAGKSTFIESLGMKGVPKISSGQLDGFTRTVSTYIIKNVTIGDGTDDGTIYLVDSPGFADTNMSEMAIVSKLQKWMEDNGQTFTRILFFTPITHIRLPGSQRQVLKTFQSLTGLKTARNITIVTTMWDSLWGQGALNRAERTFNQLQDEIWKDFIQEGAQITRFDNTCDSAVSILDVALQHVTSDFFALEEMFMYYQVLGQTPFASHLQNDLHSRIKNLRSHIATLQEDLAQAIVNAEWEVRDVLAPRLEKAEEDLARFQQELGDFDGSEERRTEQGRVVRALQSMKSWGKAVVDRRNK